MVAATKEHTQPPASANSKCMLIFYGNSALKRGKSHKMMSFRLDVTAKCESDRLEMATQQQQPTTTTAAATKKSAA